MSIMMFHPVFRAVKNWSDLMRKIIYTYNIHTLQYEVPKLTENIFGEKDVGKTFQAQERECE